MIRISSEGLLLPSNDGYYDDYLHDSRCDGKSDLSARPSTIEMRGGTASVTVIGKDKGSVSATGIDVSRVLQGVEPLGQVDCRERQETLLGEPYKGNVLLYILCQSRAV